jgi:hypothetical protein
MTTVDDAARAIAFFEVCFDVELMRAALAKVAPRVAQQVRRQLQRGGEDSVPSPAAIRTAMAPATQADALQILDTTSDFALLQAMTRAIGRRVETLVSAATKN